MVFSPPVRAGRECQIKSCAGVDPAPGVQGETHHFKFVCVSVCVRVCVMDITDRGKDWAAEKETA